LTRVWSKRDSPARLKEPCRKRKWFQVIRFPAMFTAGMRRTEQPRHGAPSASPLRSPITAFSSAAGSMLPDALQTLSLPGPDARVGLSLSCNKSRFHGFHSRVKAPALTLRFPADCFDDPFDLSLRHRNPRLRPESATSTRKARCRFHCRRRLPLNRPPLPFGTVTSLRIKVFSRPCCKPTHLPNPPDFRSLPAAFASIASCRRGSTFPDRYASGGLLFLKPLASDPIPSHVHRGHAPH
jgi:hypothetical protein